MPQPPADAPRSPLAPSDTFVRRHNGSSPDEVAAMLALVGVDSAAALVDQTVPDDIRLGRELEVGPERAERELLAELRGIAAKNAVFKSFLGTGYHDCIVPPVIQRNVLENPGWYTQYTPYQAEISQGRLEALLDYQTLVSDLCGLPIANASLLDEATAAAEALAMCRAASRKAPDAYFVHERTHPQTIAIVRTRAEAVGMALHVGDPRAFDFEGTPVAGALLSYPDTHGAVEDWREVIGRVKASGAKVVLATDLLALTLLASPGELGADVAIGSAQRLGVPMGYGGPHAAFLAATEEFKRGMPGRIIGVSVDARGEPALRMAMQTREQHIRRDKATSNICTAQVLLAVMTGFYGVYHGPEGLREIATRVHGLAVALRSLLAAGGVPVADGPVFDTLDVPCGAERAEAAHAAALGRRMNLRRVEDGRLGIALDETTTVADVVALCACFGVEADAATVERVAVERAAAGDGDLGAHARQTSYLEHPVFHEHRTEHELLRYMHRLQSKDLSLVHSMIPLGSCTMKLNATAEMLPVSWPEFGGLHPFCPADQARGYRELFERLEARLSEITGFAGFSLQPNAGSQGEYAGLLAIRAYHAANGQGHRTACLIPTSAHGTNPASAVMAGMKVVPVRCDERGNIDVDDLRAKASQHADDLGALMITYPSTHGVFEKRIREICAVVHEHGGQVYLDGANLNAQVGLARPGDYGADVCHLNLHKTFCIPHGGGGPGMGPIGVMEHLVPHLPGHPFVPESFEESGRGGAPVSAAPWGSASILPISWMYIELMGARGLREASELAILNANYMAARLSEEFSILYSGPGGRVAHEFIVDLRPFEKSAGVSAEDVAKRLMDYGFHAPTMSWPVAGTMMIEPTESESKAELDRFCDALLSIREEIRAIESGELDRDDNPLQYAPHPAAAVTADDWPHAYTRERAAFPLPWVRESKFWPSVARIDNGYGDKHLVCTCPSVEELATDPAPELANA